MLPDGANTISDRRRDGGDPRPLQIASTALEQSVFVDSRVDGILTSLLVDTEVTSFTEQSFLWTVIVEWMRSLLRISLLVDTGSVVTIIHRRQCERGLVLLHCRTLRAQ